MTWIYQSWGRRTLLGMSLGGVVYLLSPVFFYPSHLGGRRNSCQSNLKQLGLGLMQYTQDYDEKYPPVVTGGSAYGWADAMFPYVKSTQIYQCPSDQDKGATDYASINPKQPGYTDYPFNAHLDRKHVLDPDRSPQQIMLMDGNDGKEATTARYCLTQIPPLWFSDASSPLYRHDGMANFLFADGHVKALTPVQLGQADVVF